jgi:hypothetical protein
LKFALLIVENYPRPHVIEQESSPSTTSDNLSPRPIDEVRKPKKIQPEIRKFFAPSRSPVTAKESLNTCDDLAGSSRDEVNVSASIPKKTFSRSKVSRVSTQVKSKVKLWKSCNHFIYVGTST